MIVFLLICLDSDYRSGENSDGFPIFSQENSDIRWNWRKFLKFSKLRLHKYSIDENIYVISDKTTWLTKINNLDVLKIMICVWTGQNEQAIIYHRKIEALIIHEAMMRDYDQELQWRTNRESTVRYESQWINNDENSEQEPSTLIQN